MTAPNGCKGYAGLDAGSDEFAGFPLLFDLAGAHPKLLKLFLANHASLSFDPAIAMLPTISYL